ncbi:hypothetical protein BX600DRAFT_109938 [Xylariales sp. PMI_506]|nr:hypothetical protein BX600DRAFT_109938 [Xylariales sp. PMI_506]
MLQLKSKRAERLKKSRGLRAKAPIAAQFEDCLQAFQQLSDALAVNHSASQLHKASRRCRTKFRLWGDDTGASSRALDYALRDSSMLESQTLALLRDLHSILEEAMIGVRAQEPEPEEPSEGSANDEVFEDGSSLDEAVVDEKELETGPYACLQEAEDIVECLLQLLSALKSPSEDLDSKPTLQPNEVNLEAAYGSLASIVFPEAPRSLLQRLSINVARRKQGTNRLIGRSKAYRENPRRIWTSSSVVWCPPTRQGFSSNKNYSMQHPSIGTGSETGMSASHSNVESDLSIKPLPDHESVTSFTDTPQPHYFQRLAPPPPPVDLAKAEQFECPYCHFELPLSISAKGMGKEEWTAHVYLDLSPYVCTFEGCKHGRQPFRTREQWFQHELTYHRTSTVWICGLCRGDFETADQLEHHLYSFHTDLPRNLQPDILEACRRYSQTKPTLLSCCLCRMVSGNVDELENHLGNHLEVYALAASLGSDLPEEEGSESDEMIVLADFLNEQPDDQEPDEGTLLTDADTATLPTVERHPLGPGFSHIVDTSDPSGLDEPEKDVHTHVDSFLLREKVQIFLDKQTTMDPEATTVRCNLPQRNENFTGRVRDLEAIHKHLSVPGRICSISGLSGVGKTALATQYAHAFQSEYTYICWIDAETPSLRAECYLMIGSELHIIDESLEDVDAHIHLIRGTLTKTEKRWLLIFDNVNSWNDITAYVPRSLQRTNGSILVTTRLEHPLAILAKIIPTQHHITWNVDVWPLEDARKFLLTSIQSWDLDEEDLQGHEEYELAAQVVNLVDCLPIAISIIVGYVNVSRCNLAEFMEMWDESVSVARMKTGSLTGKDTNHDSTLDLLWAIGIREVRSNSRRFLDILAFLDFKTIPISLLVGNHTEDYLKFLSASETLSYKRMINELDGRRLLKIKRPASAGGETLYSIPKMLQKKILFDLKGHGLADAFRKAFRLIRKRFPPANTQQVPNPKEFEICQRYIQHVISLHRAYTEMDPSCQITDPTPHEIAELFYDAGFYVWARQTTGFSSAELLETTSKILDEIEMDENAKIRADILCLTGLDLLASGCIERRQGLDLAQKAWQIRRVVFARDPSHDNDVLLQNAAIDYSIALLNEHQFDEAGKIIKQCRQRYQAWGPELKNPFENSKYYAHYCVVLMVENKMAEAVKHAEVAVALTLKFAGKSPLYYERLFMLACIQLQAENYQGALDKHLEVLRVRIDLYGELHEFTVESIYAVGAVYHQMGYLSTATEYMKQCMQCAKNMNLDRAAVARIQCHLAELYKEQGIETDEADKWEAEASRFVEEFEGYAAECVRKLGDKMVILNDLQPTFQGRFTGRKILLCLQEWQNTL